MGKKERKKSSIWMEVKRRDAGKYKQRKKKKYVK